MVTHNRHPQSSDPLLGELARLYGVQLAYRDSKGRWRESPLESAVLVLRALGAELGDGGAAAPLRGVTPARMAAAIAERKRELWSRVVEPVIVAWEGKLPPITLRLPVGPSRSAASGGHTGGGAKVTLLLEDGAELSWDVPWTALEQAAEEEIGRARFAVYRIAGPGGRARRLPYGYHRLIVEIATHVVEAVLLSAPRRCWGPGSPDSLEVESQLAASPKPAGGPTSCWAEWGALSPLLSGTMGSRGGRSWGLFVPLYALRSARDWGAGDLADLRMFGEWVTEQGGSAVATLPLLASYLDSPLDPTPYRPASRLFWNEFYLAVDEIAEWGECRTARQLWSGAGFQRERRRLRALSLVDYAAVMALKRRVLEALAECFFTGGDPKRHEAFSHYLHGHPHAREYALFRAERETAATRSALAEEAAAGLQSKASRYHLFCQWQMEEQLARLAGRGAPGDGEDGDSKAGRSGSALCLDLPLGVHPDGFDAWRWSELFAAGVSVGAPPDTFFARGQDWAMPPLHPERTGNQGQYFAACLRTHMRHASYLRIDHVMSLHRLYWIPSGSEPADGVYVNYPADELYASLCLESHRHRTVVVGEDLGTVPTGVRASMRRHGVLGTWVMQSSLRPRAKLLLSDVPRRAVASLNTHDMFPFAGFVRGDDIVARVKTGQLDPTEAERQATQRRRLVRGLAASLPAPPENGLVGLLLGALGHLARSQAALVLVNLEDLVLETRPQNLPGTGTGQPNWRRKLRATQPDRREATKTAADEANPRSS